ncbi:hypothetical protein NIE88_02485 [Sporolactobacillus shoreicorticis]|uniref:Uncharacterized protein n=1 Tax=Sporolactobacillus shoreicorticis TaxID=1923877 RepID=A0ABW5S200_9BACL|nr:hypothetical protein [Sporolactobacillus shoreicorticis]MCO7124647.1 hypothetical protein [Sporolactobacillus shoreicorticis]
MIGIILYGCYFLILFFFLFSVHFRLETVSVILTHALIIFPGVIPLIIIAVDQRKDEQKKAKLTEKTNDDS